jgi:hypothetical protein
MSHGKVSIDREVVEGADRRWGGPGLRCRRGKGPTRTDRTSQYQLPVHGAATSDDVHSSDYLKGRVE